MKSFAAAIILILAQAGPASSDQSYSNFINKADLVVVAWMEHAGLEAEGEKTLWTVTYRVREVLKGRHAAENLTLRFDSSSFKHADRSGRGSKEKPKLLILFLRSKIGGGFSYAGPPLNSPTIMATSANLAVLRQELFESHVEEITWFDTILPGGITGLVLIGAIVVVLIALIIVVRKRPRPSTDSNDMP